MKNLSATLSEKPAGGSDDSVMLQLAGSKSGEDRSDCMLGKSWSKRKVQIGMPCGPMSE